MCGIVGYVGSDPALPVLLQGLEKLEYRGYDSAGVAVAGADGLQVARASGALHALVDSIDDRSIAGCNGIGHTRWATHGAPTVANAHPHCDCSGRLAIVHNGIIENHDVLRRALIDEGHVFLSETDSEVAAHVVESILRLRDCSLREAVLHAVGILEGSFALVCVSVDEPDRIVAARQEPPLVIGTTPRAGFVASDIPALLDHTRDLIPLENCQVAEVLPGRVRIFSFDGSEIRPQPIRVEWEVESAERQGFEDFMLKEILEQPRAIRDTLRSRIDDDGGVSLEELGLDPGVLARLARIVVVACGTSYHAGIVAKHALEHYSGIPVELDLASEFRYRDPVVDERCLVVAITQSGETADTLAAARLAQDLGATVVGVTNVVGSSITREADAVLLTRAGPEIGVAATKTYTSQLAALHLFGLYVAQRLGTMSAHEITQTTAAIKMLPRQIEEVLALDGDIHRAAKRYAGATDVLFIGRGAGVAAAMEGALKLKEISYIHAEGYAGGELKHGAIALIEEGVPVVAVLTDPHLYDKMLANVQEVRARGAETILLVPCGDSRAIGLANELLEMPKTTPLLSPVLDSVALQLFAYHAAKERSLSPDKPRNLAKCVTVE